MRRVAAILTFALLLPSLVLAGGMVIKRRSTAAAPSWQMLASDNFDRANENPLGNSTWTTATGRNAMQIVNNVAIGTVQSTYNASYWSGSSPASWPNDQYSQATYTDGPAYRRLYVRLSGDNGYEITINYDVTYIYRNDNWVGTQLATNATGWAANDNCQARAFGTTISVLKNGTEILSVVDNTYASGRPGIGMYDGVAAHYGWINWIGGGYQ